MSADELCPSMSNSYFTMLFEATLRIVCTYQQMNHVRRCPTRILRCFLKPASESLDSMLIDVFGAPPNNSTNCPKEEILVGLLIKDLEPLDAFSVYQTKAGTAV